MNGERKNSVIRKTSENFDQAVIESVNEALSVLGDDAVKNAFLHYLEETAGIKISEIPKKIDVFHIALVDLFSEDSEIIEKRISKELCRLLGIVIHLNNRKTFIESFMETKVNCELLRQNRAL